MRMRYFYTTLVLVACPSLPNTALASGLGKFVQTAGEVKSQKCRLEKPVPDSAFFRWRGTAALGSSHFPSTDEGFTSLYVDAGFRFWDTTNRCTARSGLFGGSSWIWQSMSVGLSSEVNLSDAASSSFGAIFAWDGRFRTEGWFSEFWNVVSPGYSATIGPYWREDTPGITVSAGMRSLGYFRVAAHYEVDRGFGWSAHIGISDPHLYVYELLNLD